MENTRKITNILALTVVFCLVLVQVAQAEEKSKSLKWVDHKPNPRFAIYDAATPTEKADDLVLDRKTGLIWARNANLAGKFLTWEDAITYCQSLTLCNLKRWLLPTQEELTSLVDPSRSVPALPSGHPFINVEAVHYWSSTQHDSVSAGTVVIGGSGEVRDDVFSYRGCVLPVLGR